MTESPEIDPETALAIAERAGSNARMIRAVAAAANRTRSPGLTAALAAGIAPGMSIDDLRAFVLDPNGPTPWSPGPRASRWLRAYATVVGSQANDDAGRLEAIAFFERAREVGASTPWQVGEVRLFLQLLWATGRHKELEERLAQVPGLPEEERAFIEADLEGARHGIGSAQWSARINGLLSQWDIAPVGVDGSGATMFDRLTASPVPPRPGGPLVSVIMSAYRPGDEIFTAVDSVLQQSWTEFELIVVDDASGPEYREIFSRVEAIDPRIRVLEQTVNRGTYQARNRALAEARGEFVTFQDADDWSHPERIARQVQVLLDDPEVHSSLSRSIRCVSDLTFQYLGFSVTRNNASSLLFRRSALDVMGGFDPVRKSADSEFIERLAVSLPGRRVVIPDLLAFVRLETESLSRSDFRPGWTHPARGEYMVSYRRFHKAIEAGASPRISTDPTQRRFRAPRQLVRDTGAPTEPTRFDVVVAGCWRKDSPAASALLDEALALSRGGNRVGVLQLEAFDNPFPGPRAMAPEALAHLERGTFAQVVVGDEIQTDLLLVHDPAVLQFPPDRLEAMAPGAVAILADGGQEGLDGMRRFSCADVQRVVRNAFGVEPTWVPRNPAARGALLGQGAERVHDVDVPAVVDPQDWQSVRSRPRRGRAPVMGRYSPDAPEQWPSDPMDLLDAYPTDEDVDVRILGGLSAIWELAGRPPAQWLVYREGDLSERALVCQLDFFVYFPGDRIATVPDTLVRAMAAGCVVVVPERFREQLGDAALYCRPDQVREVVTRTYASPSAFDEQVARAAAHVATGHAPERLVELARALSARAAGAAVARAERR